MSLYAIVLGTLLLLPWTIALTIAAGSFGAARKKAVASNTPHQHLLPHRRETPSPHPSREGRIFATSPPTC
jgi:hypothetical protein